MKDKIAHIKNTIKQKPGIEASLKMVIILLSLFFVVFIAIEYSEYIFTPTGVDEQWYYLNSKSVAENGTLRAAITFNGYGSAVFGANAHGFAYPLVYGVAGKIFGYSESTIIVINLILLLLSAGLIVSMKFLTTMNKFLMISIIIIHPILFYLIISYHVESFYLFFSIVLFYYIYIMYNDKASKLAIILFLMMLIVFSGFRISWIIFSFSIIPLATNKRERITYTAVAALATFVVYLGHSLFTENFDQALSFTVLLKNILEGDISAALVRIVYRLNAIFDTLTGLNIVAVFTDYAEVEPLRIENIIVVLYRWFIVMSAVYLLWIFRKHGDQFALALGLPLILFFVVIMVVGIPGHMIRYMLPATIFISLFFIVRNNKPGIIFIILIHIAIFPLTFTAQYNWLENKREKVINFKEIESISFHSISNNVIGDHRLILIDFYTDRLAFPTHELPVKNYEGSQIRYAQRYHKGIFNSDDLGFVLTLPDQSPGQTYEIEHDVRLVTQTMHYDLYELVRN